MLGQFAIPTCHAGGLKATALLRNTVRLGETVPVSLRERGMSVEVRVYENGSVVFRDERFGQIALGGVLELSEQSCPAMGPSEHERLIVARCTLADGTMAPCAQEHQLMYHVRRSGVFDSLLYDQFPVVAPRPDKPPSPILLLAPKVWIGRDHTAFVAFANTSGALELRPQAVPLEIALLDGAGNVVASRTVTENENSTLLIDARAMLAETGEVPARSKLYTMIARGGASFFAIVTFVQHTPSGNFAIEHSLSPHYYVDGDLPRVRREALRLPALNHV